MIEYILALSRYNKDIFSKLADSSENVIDHLIKIVLWPNMQEQNHWKKEVWNLIRSVPKLKSSNRFPTYSQI